MLVFKQGNCVFNYRAAGIALHHDRVLLHRSKQDAFWALPGGRVEAMETAQDTLVREMLEKINADITVGRLLYVVENFFNYNGEDYHEIGLYFLIHVPQDLYVDQPFYGIERQSLKLIFEWVVLDDLSNRAINPDFLSAALMNIGDSARHIVNQEIVKHD
jgi:ADP-ribose pyrophosphatase YjhB (NUDIX family)